jgi:hypothetical protein
MGWLYNRRREVTTLLSIDESLHEPDIHRNQAPILTWLRLPFDPNGSHIDTHELGGPDATADEA